MSIELDRDNYYEMIKESTIPVLVDFWGPQCVPCLALMPAVEKLEKEFDGKLKCAKLNATENRMLCAKLKVIGLPSFLLYKNGKEVKRITGEALTLEDVKNAVIEALK